VVRVADPSSIAELAENFDFADERVRRDRGAVYPELLKGRPGWSADAVSFRAFQAVHSVASLPVTFDPVPAGRLAAQV
jgi:hypothetical protein